MKVRLEECPEAIQERIVFELKNPSAVECQVISVERREGRPFVDKSHILITYEVILLQGNLFRIFTQFGGLTELKDDVKEDSLIIAAVQNILNNAPSWAGLPRLDGANGTAL